MEHFSSEKDGTKSNFRVGIMRGSGYEYEKRQFDSDRIALLSAVLCKAEGVKFHTCM